MCALAYCPVRMGDFFPPLSFFSLNILAVCRFFIIICMKKMFLFGWLIFKMLKEEFSDIFNIKN